MSARRTALTGLLAALLVVLPRLVSAQAPPLEAHIFLRNAPAGAIYHATAPGTPLTIVLQLTNPSGGPVLTTEGFSQTEFWRRLFFGAPEGGVVVNTAEAVSHRDERIGFCQYRNGVALPVSLPVVAAELLDGPPTPFVLEFEIDDARLYYDLTRPGRYTVNARIPLLTFGASGLINDCDQFPAVTLVDVGQGGLTRQEHLVVSNALEFTILGDSVAPTTTIAAAPAPNGAGWNRENVTLTLSATDDPGGSGVARIVASATGAQTGTQTVTGASGLVTVSVEGTTTVAIHAEDNAGNAEADQLRTIRIDKTAPSVTPPGAISVVATLADGTATGSTSPGLAAFLAGGSASDALDPAPVRLAPQVGGADATGSTVFPLGTTSVAFRYRDAADNVGTAASTVSVVPGTPRMSGSIVGKGVDNGGQYYDLRLTNTGTGWARNISVSQLTFRTLSGTGTVTRDAARTTLPIGVGDLAVGASATVRLFLIVPSTVTRFSIGETGPMQSVAGTAYNFSLSQATTP